MDDITKECLTVSVAFGISGVQVTRILDSIALFRVYPATIRTYQGPEVTCRALDQWAFEHRMELRLIQAGKPTQNGFIESFHDECLNEHWFSDVSRARKTISEWRQDYNECRPYSALNYQTPSEFAAAWRKGNSDSKGSDINNVSVVSNPGGRSSWPSFIFRTKISEEPINNPIYDYRLIPVTITVFCTFDK